MTPSAENLGILVSGKAALTAYVTAIASGVTGLTGNSDVLGNNGTLLTEIGVVAGVFLGITGTIIQTYFSYRRDKREQDESTWRMGIDPDRRKNNTDGDA